ncbi:MAG: hypothetical protein MJA28_03020 [Gammaproteobacteria bacterium]|nr:hypothetical protein [Gammaproteobacteria bacterium]
MLFDQKQPLRSMEYLASPLAGCAFMVWVRDFEEELSLLYGIQGRAAQG